MKLKKRIYMVVGCTAIWIITGSVTTWSKTDTYLDQMNGKSSFGFALWPFYQVGFGQVNPGSPLLDINQLDTQIDHSNIDFTGSEIIVYPSCGCVYIQW